MTSPADVPVYTTATRTLSDDDQLIEASASRRLVAALLVWEQVNAAASPCEFAWEGCQAYPDASTSGWLAESAAIADAQLWRSIGNVARQLVEQLAEQRDSLITAATRRIVGLMNRPSASESTAEVAPAGEELRDWLNVSRTPGSFLAL